MADEYEIEKNAQAKLDLWSNFKFKKNKKSDGVI